MKQTFLKTFFLSALAVLASVPAYALDGYSMQIADFEIKAGETKKVEISMDNATEISALSLEMRLPQGFTVGTDKRGNPAVTQTERAYDQMLKANLDGQVLKVATLSNEAYDGNSGAVLVVPIVAGGDVKAGSYTVSLYNVKFSSPQGKLYDVDPSSCKATVPATLVESIAFANAEESLRASETLTLSPTVMPSNATTKALAWTSDNEEAATVADGVVKGVSPGEAVITATATDGSGVSASCKVTVTPGVVKATSITMSQTEAIVEAGHSLTLTATVTPGVVKATSITMSQTEAIVEAGHSLTLTATVMPHDVTNPAVVWRTSSSEIATVKDGVVTTLKAGSVTISAETADGTNLKAYCTLTVTKPAAVDYLVVDDFTTNPGKTFTLPVAMVNADEISAIQMFVDLPEGVGVAVDKRGNPAVKHDADRWYDQQLKANLDGQTLKIATLSNEAYNGNSGTLLTIPLVIDKSVKGSAYPVRVYNAKLSTPAGKLIECDDFSFTMTVEEIKATGIAIDQAEASVEVGKTVQLTASVSPADASCTAVVWDSSDKAVATVSSDGVVTGLSTGQTFITATTTDGTLLSAQCIVTVTERVYANYFAISDFEAMQGEESVLPIELVNANEISAVQLQVVLPEGISVKADKRGNPMVKHDADRWYDQQLKANLVGQTLKIATLSNEAYNGNSGTLLNATLTIDENMVSGIYTIKIINAKLSTPAGVLIECPDAECSVTVGDVSDVGITQRIETKVFGLEGLIAVCNAEGKTADIYTPDGRLVASHLCSSSADRLSVQKGAYLVKVLGNTTKVIVY